MMGDIEGKLVEIRCLKCNKLLLEGTGEIRKVCPKCKEITHVVTTSKGIINLDK